MFPRRLVVTVLVPLGMAAVAPMAHAQEPASLVSTQGVDDPKFARIESTEGIDDPKVARRLGTRIDLPPGAAAAPDAAPLSSSPGFAGGGSPGFTGGRSPVAAEAPAFAPVAPETLPDAGVAPPPDVAQAALPGLAGDARPGAVGEVDGARSGEGTQTPRTPRLKLGYRRFTFAQVGATAMSGPGVDEPFDVLSIDLYPVSSTWRFGLSTQYGWQSGTFRQGGDAFIAEAVSLGGQIPGVNFTPFFEVYAGGGYMQRTHAALNSIATAYGQLGVDVGSEVFLASHFCVSGAIGFIHGANGFVKDAKFGSFSVDTLSFKLGVGL
jgi:hypothetical protein